MPGTGSRVRNCTASTGGTHQASDTRRSGTKVTQPRDITEQRRRTVEQGQGNQRAGPLAQPHLPIEHRIKPQRDERRTMAGLSRSVGRNHDAARA